MFASKSIVAYVSLSAIALSSPNLAAVIGLNSIAELGVTASLCEALDINIAGAQVLNQACVAAGLAVGTKVGAVTGTRSGAYSGVKPVPGSSPKDNYKNSFLEVFGGCQSLSGQLNQVLAGTGKLAAGTVATLSLDVVVPTLAKVSSRINALIVTTQGVNRCADSESQATVYQSYVALSASLQSVFSALVTLPNLYAKVEVKAAVNAALVQLQSSLQVLINKLFVYVSADLDHKNTKAALLLSIDLAIKSTTCDAQ